MKTKKQTTTADPRGRRSAASRRLAVLAAVVAVAGIPAASRRTTASSSTEIDVMAWIANTDPSMVIDQSAGCMAGATDAVAYRGDVIVLRSSMTDPAATALIEGRLSTLYATGAYPWVSAIERISFPPISPPGPASATVLSITLRPRPDGKDHDILRLARSLRGDPGTEASPDYVMTPSGPYSYFWPNGAPEKIDELTPPRVPIDPNDGPIGTGTKVEIYDTGGRPSLPGEPTNSTMLANRDLEFVNILANGPHMADYPHAFHATAIAGVIATIAPGVAIEQVRISDRAGLATDVSATRGIASSLSALPRADFPELMINAFGSPACDVDPTAPGPELEPVGLDAVAEVVDRFDATRPDGMLIVASAGNMASSRPHYPAAFDTVVGVGALDGTIDSDGSPWTSPSGVAPKAAFSNDGWWVDVWTVGVDLPTTHADGLRFEYGGDILDGKGAVDGTSFSAPTFAAMILEQMWASGRDARASYSDLVDGRPDPLPACGSELVPHGKAVVLPSMESAVGDPATGTIEGC